MRGHLAAELRLRKRFLSQDDPLSHTKPHKKKSSVTSGSFLKWVTKSGGKPTFPDLELIELACFIVERPLNLNTFLNCEKLEVGKVYRQKVGLPPLFSFPHLRVLTPVNFRWEIVPGAPGWQVFATLRFSAPTRNSHSITCRHGADW